MLNSATAHTVSFSVAVDVYGEWLIYPPTVASCFPYYLQEMTQYSRKFGSISRRASSCRESRNIFSRCEA